MQHTGIMPKDRWWSYIPALGAAAALGALSVPALTSSSMAGEARVTGKPSPAPSIPAGTRLAVRLNSTLSTKSSSRGSTFTATLLEPLKDGDRVVVPKGAQVDGRVLQSNPGGRVKGRAAIAVQLTRIHAASGRVIPIQTSSVWRSARRTRRRDALMIGGASGTGAGIGALAGGGIGAAIGAGAGAGVGTGAVLLTRGAPAVIPAESLLTFRLRSPASL